MTTLVRDTIAAVFSSVFVVNAAVVVVFLLLLWLWLLLEGRKERGERGFAGRILTHSSPSRPFAARWGHFLPKLRGNGICDAAEEFEYLLF